MESSPKSFDPQILARIEGLHLRARHIVEGFVAGLHRSPYQGFSIEFAEHREYAPGDDLRYLDWKAFGRTDKLYLKQFEDETNLQCMLIVDVSESMRYKSEDEPLSKYEYAQCIAASLAWLVLRQQDAVGLATFDDQLRSFQRPTSSPDVLKQIIQVLESAEKWQGKLNALPMVLQVGPTITLIEKLRSGGLAERADRLELSLKVTPPFPHPEIKALSLESR